jgi:DNA-binding CsgD family transcriptional regulator/tetratricopeptide (TPR) repeat protein
MSPPGFVGRSREMAAFEQAMAQQPTVVLIEGEAGIGKTRLVSEYRDAGHAHSAVVAWCPPFRHPHTLSPVVDAIRRATVRVCDMRLSGLAGVLRPLFPEWADELPPAPAPAEDASAARHRVFCALAEVLGQLSVDLLVLEDAHWADEATLEFLLFLATPPQRVGLVVTCRPEEVPAGSLLRRLSRYAVAGRRLSLDGLDGHATAGLVSSMLGGARVSGEFASFLCERTGGVPLTVEESVRLMVDRGDILIRNGQVSRRALAEIAVPPSLRDAVLERVRRLGREAVAVLWAAAVFANPADERLLRTLSGLPAGRLRSGLAEALDSGLLVADGTGVIRVSFRHALVCRAVYEAIPAPQCRVLHLRAGRALEQVAPLPVAQLAAHFRGAREIGKWCEYAEQAADIALTPGDEATASALLHDLVVHADLPADAVARLTGKIAFTFPPGDPRFGELVEALRGVLGRGGLTRTEAAQVRVQLGRVLGVMEDFSGAYAELERAAPHLPNGSEAAARAMLLLGWPQGVIRPVASYRRWLQRAGAVTESLDPAQRLNFLAHRAAGLLMLGEEEGWAEAARIPGDAETAPERLILAVGTMNIGEMARVWGRYDEAGRLLARSLALAEGGRHARCRSIILVQQAHLDWLTGAWDGLAERAAALAADQDLAAVSRLEAELVTGLLYKVAGDHAGAARALRRAHAGMLKHVPLAGLQAVAELARLHLAVGDTDEALRITHAPAEILAGKGFWVYATEIAPVRVAALVAAGRVNDGAELVTGFVRGLGQRDAPAPHAALATCRALIAEAHGDAARAAAAFAHAADAWAALPRPYDALLAREAHARCLLDRSGSAEAARDLLADVWQKLSALGAAADADRIAHELRRYGVTVRAPWSGGRRGYGDQLSPRECEVLAYLTTGASTREIARRLSRSPDTVYSQLRSAMRKLGVRSRAALAVRAAELGLAPTDRDT